MQRALLFSLWLAACGGSSSTGNDLAVAGDLAVAADLATPIAGGCDVVKQNCGDPTLKCTILEIGGSGKAALAAGCTPVLGSAGLGNSCSSPDTLVGHDTCATGALCTPLGGVGDDAICRKLCLRDGDCQPGDRCAAVDPGNDGVCLTPCTLFADSCGAGLDCALIYPDVDARTGAPDPVPLCREVGGALPGDHCDYDTECGPGERCDVGGSNQCQALCDNANPCPGGDGGLGCQPNGLPNGAGTCG